MRLILLGAPGAGKGSVAKLLMTEYGAVQISTGDILRREIASGSDLGKQVEGCMNSGELVPDHLVLGIMERRLREPDCAKGYVLDGFPRTLPQARALDDLLAKLRMPLNAAVELKVRREIVMGRLTTRRTCSNSACQEIYNVVTKPPRVAGICDRCGSPVVHRDDETEEAIDKRLVTYSEKTAPLIDYYRVAGLLVDVDGAGSSADAVRAIRAALRVRAA